MYIYIYIYIVITPKRRAKRCLLLGGHRLVLTSRSSEFPFPNGRFRTEMQRFCILCTCPLLHLFIFGALLYSI